MAVVHYVSQHDPLYHHVLGHRVFIAFSKHFNVCLPHDKLADESTDESIDVMSSMKLVIPLHFISWKKDSKRCFHATAPVLIHTKDESKRGSAFTFIFGVN